MVLRLYALYSIFPLVLALQDACDSGTSSTCNAGQDDVSLLQIDAAAAVKTQDKLGEPNLSEDDEEDENELGLTNGTDTALVQWPHDEPWMAAMCEKRCRAAGFCCNDYRTGSNQMISCAQACMMRARGVPLEDLTDSQNGYCKRTGSSGCSLEVKGYKYGFCWRCSDLKDSPKCRFGVPDDTACNYGAALTFTPEEYCSSACKAAGFCCNDYSIGSNQMISCAQACMMRARGSSWHELAYSANGLCKRTNQNGCTLIERGHSYGFCWKCADLTNNPKCKDGVAGPEACDYGASLAPPTEGGELELAEEEEEEERRWNRRR